MRRRRLIFVATALVLACLDLWLLHKRHVANEPIVWLENGSAIHANWDPLSDAVGQMIEHPAATDAVLMGSSIRQRSGEPLPIGGLIQFADCGGLIEGCSGGNGYTVIHFSSDNTIKQILDAIIYIRAYCAAEIVLVFTDSRSYNIFTASPGYYNTPANFRSCRNIPSRSIEEERTR